MEGGRSQPTVSFCAYSANDHFQPVAHLGWLGTVKSQNATAGVLLLILANERQKCIWPPSSTKMSKDCIFVVSTIRKRALGFPSVLKAATPTVGICVYECEWNRVLCVQ